jgi:glycine cleavage system H protein
MNIPDNLKYTKEHEWIRVEGDVAYAGVTDYAQSELGDIIFVQVKTEGELLAKGELFGVVEAVKTTSEVFMPISAKVLEFNAALESAPELINSDPYGEGWIIKIAFTDSAELNSLLSADEYAALLG